MHRRLPQICSNSTTECTDGSDGRKRVRNHHDQPHEELSISSSISSCPQLTSSTRNPDTTISWPHSTDILVAY